MPSRSLGVSAVGAAALLFSAQVCAFDISPFVSLGITFGGDTLDETQVGDPKLQNIKSIKAGQFMYFSAGATVPLQQASAWEAQASLGYWFDSVQTGGRELRFRRVPMDLLLVRNFDQRWRLLGGVAYHLNAERRCTLDACTQPNTTFENAIGLIMEADWLFGGVVTHVAGAEEPRPNKLWMGMRLTLIDYKTVEADVRKYNGNNLGWVVGLNF